MIFYEQDWNPQVDKQALQRAHRIGQMNHVLTINLVTGRTIEEARYTELTFTVESCVDDSGNWGHGRLFDALAKLSTSIPSAYEQASEVGDLHLGDLHLIEIAASIHMPRIGYQDGSDRSEWYTVERLLRKYAAIYGVKIFVYYFRRSA